ncbi:Ig-like domain-containing protein [Vibrio aestuarianus]|uniref:Ig-like domain-containing protein n=1 Tax=Vibrio aestuarianus TaxID=28171 RepID=UPI00237CE15B|nr:Ig-like domain-containing protein [Vibrio aestuarianus]MDE1351614.1 Ig-like domain-containing protein [Vibrio aestuarianus]
MKLKAKNSAILIASLVALLSGCRSDSPDNTVTLSKLMVSPKSSSFGVSGVEVPVGYNQEFIATAQYSDNTTKDVTDLAVWLSSDQAKAMMDGAILKALEEGNTSVSAKLQGTASANALEVLVTSAVLNEIVISPPVNTVPNGINYSLEVVGNFSDGTGRLLDLEDGDFYSLDPSIADVTVDGQVVTVSPGSATIVIEKDGVTATASVTVTAAELVSINFDSSPTSAPLGLSAQLTATGEYTDETTEDLTSNVEWNSSNPAIASIDRDGLVTPKQAGQVEITATKDGVSTLMSFEVLDAQLASIEIDPSVESTPKGVTVQLTATGSYTDGEDYELTDGSWISSNDSAATVNNGLVTPVAIGSTTITVTKDGISASKEFDVTAAELVSIQLDPSVVSTPLNQTVQMVAMGEFTDGENIELREVSWTSSDINIASTDQQGLVTPVALGSTTINATKDGVTSSASFEVVVVDEVSVGELTFHRPFTLDETNARDIVADSNYTTNGMTISLFNYFSADALCEKATIGGHSDWRLPTISELNSLYSTTVEQGVSKAYGWPTGYDYRSATVNDDGIRSEMIHLHNGANGNGGLGFPTNVSCVRSDKINTVKVGELTFYRPLSLGEANARGFTPDATTTETGVNGPNGMVVSQFTWSNADALCENVEMGGYADWRLPTRDELSGLYDTTADSDGAYNTYGWPTLRNAWSSTLDGAGKHFVVNLAGGYKGGANDSTEWYVSCVRGGMQNTVNVGELTFHRPLSESEAVAKGFIPDSTHTETGTGMVVSLFNWNNADALCENIETGGHADWRLPSLQELDSLYYSAIQGVAENYGWAVSKDYWSGSYCGQEECGTNNLKYQKWDIQSVNANLYVSCVR